VTRKWDPLQFPDPGYYWPADADIGEGPEDLQSGFEAIGYEECRDGSPEPGYEKVALYVGTDGIWTHAARLTPVGWVSKIGNLQDITHTTPQAFDDSCYGRVFCYMRRPIRAITWQPA
jgi:hypothetical protein